MSKATYGKQSPGFRFAHPGYASFAKDMVSSTIQNLIEAAPKYSSKILIMSRRVGDCPGQEKGKTL